MSSCPICGEKTFKVYGRERKDKLCGHHAFEFMEGLIVQCEDCGKWHSVDDVCSCKIKKDNDVIVIDSNNRSRCLTCGSPTDGLLFCPHCYQKYKNKDLLFKISNGCNVQLLHEQYSGRYKTKDGHVVKSAGELEILNYLDEQNIPFTYEPQWYYGKEDNEYVEPDFCLFDYLGDRKDVYIEFFGYDNDNKEYYDRKKFKLIWYVKNEITLICFYKTDFSNIAAALKRKLNKVHIEEGKINFANKEDSLLIEEIQKGNK